jgi:iron-sulfur cluster repair protein YtfE (RIC family)
MTQAAEQHSVAGFENNHRRIAELIFRGRDLVRASSTISPSHDEGDGGDEGARAALRDLLIELRDELIMHFAREEEGLFPFVREHVPDLCDAVDRLAVAHDNICSAVVGLAHLAAAPDRSKDAALQAALATFERAYALHEREERDVLRGLGERLEHRQQTELGELVRSL